MDTLEEITDRVLTIIRREANDPAIGKEDVLKLDSIQILKTLAAFERTFLVEIEDEYVFSGMFESPVLIGRYIHRRMSD